MIYSVRRFSKVDSREDVPKSLLEKVKKSGVIQKYKGSWRIISLGKGKFWTPKYTSKHKSQQALRGYHSRK